MGTRGTVLNLIQFPSRRRDSSVVEGDKRNNSKSIIDLSNSCCMPVGGAKRVPSEFFPVPSSSEGAELDSVPVAVGGTVYTRPFLGTNGGINSDCASTAFSRLRRIRDEDANITSRDVNTCGHELCTGTLLGYWSQNVSQSSPRRSVPGCHIDFKFCNVSYARSFLFK